MGVQLISRWGVGSALLPPCSPAVFSRHHDGERWVAEGPKPNHSASAHIPRVRLGTCSLLSVAVARQKPPTDPSPLGREWTARSTLPKVQPQKLPQIVLEQQFPDLPVFKIHVYLK